MTFLELLLGKSINKKILAFAVCLSLPFGVSAVPAEEGYDPPVEHRLERLTKELQLNPDQQAKLDVIFKEQHEKFRAIHEESHSRIKDVLNPEQLHKWEDMKKQHQEKRRQMLQQQRLAR